MSEPEVGSDMERLLARLDALSDEDIDYSDAPQPDLAEWIRESRRFQGYEVGDGPPLSEAR